MLSSPSGGGKSTIARHLMEARDDVTCSVSATTRSPRAGEVDGREYHFVTRPEFQRRVAAGEFAEWAEYGGELYGTLKTEIERGRQAGHHVVLDIDVAGARQVRERFPDSVHVFVLPPSAAALRERLEARDTEKPDGIARRTLLAGDELRAAPEYDFIVVNDDLVEAVSHVAAILDVEVRRVSRLRNLPAVIEQLRRDLAGLQPKTAQPRE